MQAEAAVSLKVQAQGLRLVPGLVWRSARGPASLSPPRASSVPAWARASPHSRVRGQERKSPRHFPLGQVLGSKQHLHLQTRYHRRHSLLQRLPRTGHGSKEH